MKVTRVGRDIAEQVFQAHGEGQGGRGAQRSKRRGHSLMWARAATIAATLVVAVVVINFRTPERRYSIKYAIFRAREPGIGTGGGTSRGLGNCPGARSRRSKTGMKSSRRCWTPFEPRSTR